MNEGQKLSMLEALSHYYCPLLSSISQMRASTPSSLGSNLDFRISIYQETGAASAGTSASDVAIASIQRLKQRMIAKRFGGLDEGLVSRHRRAIREKIETESKIRKWFQDLTRLST
jgi:hypothetical protein